MNDADFTKLWAEINQRLEARDVLLEADRGARRNRGGTIEPIRSCSCAAFDSTHTNSSAG
jgi:hypothetical protein